MSPHPDPRQLPERPSEPGALIRTERLNKVYHGAVPTHALRDVSLAIQAGEMLALVGPSGSGKSTLMNILGCLDRPTSGSYWLSGKLLTEYSEDALADVRNREIGFVFQSFNLLPRYSALQNVTLPLLYGNTRGEEPRRLAAEALERVGLGDKLSSRPNELSGGQKQRVAIARAIINRPRILFADEPTGALDTVTSAEIMGLFHELNRSGITVILVTHEPEIAAECRRIVRMRDGRIVSDEASA